MRQVGIEHDEVGELTYLERAADVVVIGQERPVEGERLERFEKRNTLLGTVYLSGNLMFPCHHVVYADPGIGRVIGTIGA